MLIIEDIGVLFDNCRTMKIAQNYLSKKKYIK
jgi:hypothetical protein